MKLLATCFMTALTLVWAGCGSSGGGNNDGSQGPQQVKMVDKTDLSRCQGNTPLGASVYSKWTGRQEADNGFTVDLTMEIQPNSITMSTSCNYRSDTQTAQITVPANVTGSTITILRADKQDATSGNLRCSVNAEAMTINYRLVGDCLAMTHQGQTQYMVRSEN